MRPQGPKCPQCRVACTIFVRQLICIFAGSAFDHFQTRNRLSQQQKGQPLEWNPELGAIRGSVRLALKPMHATVLISHLQEGISDLAGATLPKSTVGPIEVSVLERALKLCISDHKDLDGIHELDPRFVLAEA